MADIKLTAVYRSQGMLSAQVVKGKLESAGIPCLLRYESMGQVLGLTIDGLGLVEVWVPETLADLAAALIEDAPSVDEDETSADDEVLPPDDGIS